MVLFYTVQEKMAGLEHIQGEDAAANDHGIIFSTHFFYITKRVIVELTLFWLYLADTEKKRKKNKKKKMRKKAKKKAQQKKEDSSGKFIC